MSDKDKTLAIIAYLEGVAEALHDVNKELEEMKERCYGWKCVDVQVYAQQAERSTKIATAKAYELVKSLTEDEADAVEAEPIKKEPF